MRRSILGSGEPDELTLPEQMVLGPNQFRHLYEDVSVTVNDDWNAQSGTAGAEDGVVATSRSEFDKQLKDYFFPRKVPVASLQYMQTSPMVLQSPC